LTRWRHARQRATPGGIHTLAIADEGLDDLQRGARLPLGPATLEIGGELTIGAQNLLLAKLLNVDAGAGGRLLSGRAHRS